MVRVTDKSFVYTPSYDTDLGKKFRAIIAQQRKAALERPQRIRRPAIVPATGGAWHTGPT